MGFDEELLHDNHDGELQEMTEEELRKRLDFLEEEQRRSEKEYEELTGTSFAEASMQAEAAKKIEAESVFCPRCGSAQLTANKKGFTLGKAVAGGLLLGPAGLLGGFFGSNKVIITCLKCGHQWKP